MSRRSLHRLLSLVILTIAPALSSGVGQAQQQSFDDMAAEITARSKVMLDESVGRRLTRAGAPAISDRSTEVLASASMGDAALRRLFESVAGRPEVIVVFRGVLPGETIITAMQRIHALLNGLDPPPNVVIDPTKFRAVGATTAPIVVLREGGHVVSIAGGLIADQYLLDREQAGETGDLGILGPTVEIAEVDLIEEMQRQAANLDMTAARRRAVEGFWEAVRFEVLPTATDDRIRKMDPTVTVTSPITDADGKVLIPKGHTVNPLDQLPFTTRLLVFDSGDPRQVALVAKLAAEVKGRRRVTLAITSLDRSKGWEGFRDLENALSAPVYLLTGDVRARFQIERTPTMVEAQGRVFIITEFGMKE
jgi:conjugal transfer pilus assembly protein TraW